MALILVVEDDASVAELIADTLIQRGHEARAAVSAAHALMLVNTERPDLILLGVCVGGRAHGPGRCGTVAARAWVLAPLARLPSGTHEDRRRPVPSPRRILGASP